MSKTPSIRLSLAVFAGALLLSGCGIFSGSNVPPGEQARLARINATLPFEVTIDGQKAETATEISAKIAFPVRKDADFSLGAPNKDVIVISFFPCDKDGIVKSGGTPALIILRSTSKGSLADTLDKKPLSPGFHLMRITAGEQTASVLLDVSKANKHISNKAGK